MKTMLKVLAAMCFAAVAGSASAQSVVDGGVTFTITNFGSATNEWAVVLQAPTGGANDQLFEYDFFYRFAGDPGQIRLGTPTTNVGAGNVITLTWADVGAAGRISMTMTFTLVGLNSGNDATVTMESTMTNLTATPQVVDFFWYSDADVDNSPGGDTAVLVNANDRIAVTDAPDTIEMFGAGADAFEVRTFAANLDTAVRDTAVVFNANNTGLPFAVGDFTGVFQWVAEPLPGNATIEFRGGAGQNVTALPVEVSEIAID